jgi:hypothetical protein
MFVFIVITVIMILVVIIIAVMIVIIIRYNYDDYNLYHYKIVARGVREDSFYASYTELWITLERYTYIYIYTQNVWA